MCGRYTLTRGEKIAEDFEAALSDAPRSEWWKPRFNVAPTQPAPVIVAVDPAREAARAGTEGPGEGAKGAAPEGAQGAAREFGRKVEMMRWGLVPHWAGPGGKGAPLMINARVESLEAKAVFRDALRRRRCLVPVDGFYEWLRDPKAGSKAKPQPIYMHPASRRLVAFAGLWAWHRDHAGDTLSFTVITGKPNELVRLYHDRMPIIVAPSAYAAWLDPNVDGAAARALLGVPPVDDWIAEPVSTIVNSATRDEPACIEPLAARAPAQQSLF
jgi:putative SOS response-associated peptidase YedK